MFSAVGSNAPHSFYLMLWEFNQKAVKINIIELMKVKREKGMKLYAKHVDDNFHALC